MDKLKDKTYRVDVLFKELGLYKSNMTPTEVNNILSTGIIKYLSEVVDETDKSNTSLYNVECLPIDFGEFAHYSATESAELEGILVDYRKTKNFDFCNNFSLINGWKLFSQVEQIEIKINLKDIDPSLASESVVYIVSRKPVSAWKKFIDKYIIETGESEAIYNGEKVALFHFITVYSDGKEIAQQTFDQNATLKISCAIHRIKKEHPKFEWTCDNLMGKFLTCYDWVYDTYSLTYKAYEQYIKKCAEVGIAAHSRVHIEPRQVPIAESIKRKVVGELLLKEWNIKPGQTALFSVAPFNIACYAKSYDGVVMLSLDENGHRDTIKGSAQISSLTYDSVFIARVDNYNEEYLVLQVFYRKVNIVTSLKIPVPWETFLADFELCETSEANTDSLFMWFEMGKKVEVSKFLAPIAKTPILLTEANCLDLRKPSQHFSLLSDNT